MICDFCSEPDPVWCYPAKDHLALGGGISVGDWAACDECHQLIEAGQIGELADRSFGLMLTVAPELAGDASRIKSWLSETHAGFTENRTGPARPITVQELEENR